MSSSSEQQYRGVPYTVNESFVGYPGLYVAIVGKFDHGNRHIIRAETIQELFKEIDEFLDSQE